MKKGEESKRVFKMCVETTKKEVVTERIFLIFQRSSKTSEERRLLQGFDVLF